MLLFPFFFPMTPRNGHLLQLPNELVLYIMRYFLDLPDLWCLYGTSKELRYFSSTVIKTTWKINIYGTLMKLQCRAALISLSSSSSLGKEEKKLHAQMMKGIASYKHKYVLIEDIDIRNRIRTTVDVVFHHAIFVSAIYRTRNHKDNTNAAVWVRLLTELDTAFPSYCREITFTCADNIKAFLEYTSYKIMAQHQQHITLYSIWACFDFMGAAFIGKILTDHHIECAVQRTCDLLLSNHLVTFKKSLLVHLLDHWLITCKGASDLVRFIRLEIEK